MASKALWEVDPETRSKLTEIQKTNANDRCCDCNAPSPQWASPKFGIFICLSCAGIHRGLGVHISFVRSITMDAFKAAEIERMRLGGNEGWRRFFEGAEENVGAGICWDDTTIAERYSGDIGEEYKERLTSKVEGKEYVKSSKPTSTTIKSSTNTTTSQLPTYTSTSRSQTPLSSSNNNNNLGRNSPADPNSRKAKVDAEYFARLGADNASRPDGVAPSQGGKYGGFGSGGWEPSSNSNSRGVGNGSEAEEKLPGLEDLQRDPVAALTKGFGWFTATVGKTAKSVNEGLIQPTAQKLAESDLTTNARLTAAQLARTAQTSAKTAGEGFQNGFNRFVEGNNNNNSTDNRGFSDRRRTSNDNSYSPISSSSRQRKVPLDESKKDFWDSFGGMNEERPRASVGTAALRMGGGSGSNGGVGGSGKSGGVGGKKEEGDEWDNW